MNTHGLLSEVFSVKLQFVDVEVGKKDSVRREAGGDKVCRRNAKVYIV